MTPDPWYLISNTGTWHVITWHVIPDTWYLNLTIDMLSLDTWHMLSLGTDTFDMMLWHLTGYYYTWHLWYIAYSWLSLLRGPWHDYYTAIRHIVHLNSSTPVSPALMSPTLLLLLIARSYRRPAEHPWCRDDEDVSHDHASVWQILNETKCHTEQSATPHGHL